MEYKTKSSTENYTIEQKSVLDALSALCPQYINMLLKHFLFTAGEEYEPAFTGAAYCPHL